MTALVAHSPDFRLSWPRIGALSGTFALHAAILLLLLAPPIALQVMQHQEVVEPIVRFIDPPPPVVQVPDPPRPPVRQVRQPPPAPRPHHVETVVPPVDSAPPSDVAYESNDVAPPGPVEAPVQDTAPTQLAYGGHTKVAYPIESIRHGEHGRVILRVLVGTDGNVQAVEIERSSGFPRLDAAARDAVRHWTFRPGTRNGVAQSAWALIPIAFDLNQI